MMNVCKVRDLEIGSGNVKVCVPVVGCTQEDILEKITDLEKQDYDFLELRLDYFQDVHDMCKVKELLQNVRQVLSRPLLLTCRSSKEGGQVDFQEQDMQALIDLVCQDDIVDMLDLEMSYDTVALFRWIEELHRHHIQVVLSSHYFDCKPDNEDIRSILDKMDVLGGDVLKVATIVNYKKDVIDVMNVTLEMSSRIQRPLVVIGMGELGKITRIAGSLMGSAVTFASYGQESAPGQFSLEDIHIVLEAISHD